MVRRILLATVLVLSWTSLVLSAESKKEDIPKQHEETAAENGRETAGQSSDKVSVTQHSITIDGRKLDYTATAGFLHVDDESGKHKSTMFFVAYTVNPGEKQPPRPVTFAFNGGPGAASMWLHLGAIGPKRVPLNGNVPPAPPYKLVDNDSTWLAFTDLVFIDPVGTGFSRPAQGEAPDQFYGLKEDIESVGRFIRLYTSKYERWMSPKFIAGESYGTLRAVGLAGHLYDRYGMDLNGLILISMALNFQTFTFKQGNDLPYLLYLPSYTAAAWYHKKLAPGLQQDLYRTLTEVETWAFDEYATALAKGNLLSDEERDRTAGKLSEYTGLPVIVVKNANLRIDRYQFMNELLRSENLSISIFDSRAKGYGETGNVLNDPGLAVTIGPYTATINNYVREELKFETDLPYIFLSFDSNGKWNWGSASKGYVNFSDDLQQAINRSRHLKVFTACGYFDLDTPYFGSIYTMAHLNLQPDLRKNITLGFYDGGHQLYSDEAPLKKLEKDVRRFYRDSIPGT